MSTKEALAALIERMPEVRLREVLDFALFVSRQAEHEAWTGLALEGLARAYGPDEPEYTEADLKPEAAARGRSARQ